MNRELFMRNLGGGGFDHFKFLLELDKPITEVTENTVWLADWIETRVAKSYDDIGFPISITNEYYPFYIGFTSLSLACITTDEVNISTGKISPTIIALGDTSISSIKAIHGSYKQDIRTSGRIPIYEPSELSLEMLQIDGTLRTFTFKELPIPINTKWLAVLVGFPSDQELKLTVENFGMPYGQ